MQLLNLSSTIKEEGNRVCISVSADVICILTLTLSEIHPITPAQGKEVKASASASKIEKASASGHPGFGPCLPICQP